jgi:hypothetical protein
MAETSSKDTAEGGFQVKTFFVRSRNALYARVDMSDLYVDYYLHLSENGIKPAPEHDALFKRALAGFVLHSVSRPWNEMTAWTMNFQDPRVNLFLTGDNETGGVAGRVFAENVRELPENLLYADVVRGKEAKRRSTINFTGADPLVAVEKFYEQSEQRLGRFFQTGEEEFTFVIEHPDCDRAWLSGLTVEQVKAIETTETLSLLESRVVKWSCGCNQRRMLEVLAPAMRADATELFGGEEKIEIRCPRCAARYTVTREAMEAFIVEKP